MILPDALSLPLRQRTVYSAQTEKNKLELNKNSTRKGSQVRN